MLRRLSALAVAATLATALVEPVAQASVPAHDPVGRLDSVRVTGAGGQSVPTGWHSGSYINVSGWSFDPDARATSEIVRSYDGRTLRWRNYTKIYRRDVDRVFGLRGNHGYASRYAVANGTHRICTLQENIGVGASNWSNCISVTVNGSPYGSFDSATDTSWTTIHVTGWTADPDDTRISSSIRYTLDGGPPSTPVAAAGTRPDVNSRARIPGNHGFAVDINADTSRAHTVCLIAANLGPSAPNTSLGCKTLTPPQWRQIPSPVNRGAAFVGVFNAVSCVASRFCVEVGSADSNLLVASGDPTAPAQSVLPGLSGYGAATLNGVSCPGAGTCYAVGSVAPGGSQAGAPVVASLAKGSWTVQIVPRPSYDSRPQLTAVSCRSVTDCVAVGYSNGSGTNHAAPFAEVLSGTTWSPVLLPTVGDSGTLASVSCPTSTFCVAVGQSYQNSYDAGALIEAMQGAAWTASAAPSPSGGSAVALNGVSCRAADGCVAVGTTGSGRSLLETLGPGGWFSSELATPAGLTQTSARGVSCVSSNECTVVMDGYAQAPAVGPPVAYTLIAGTWIADVLPNDTNSRGNHMSGLSCTSAVTCVGVGYETLPMVGSGWGMQPMLEVR